METRSNAGMKPIFTIFQILALYPLPNPIIYTIFTVLSFSVGIWMLVSLLILSPIFTNGSMRVFMGHVVFIIRAIVPMIIIVQAYCTRSKQVQIFQILNKVDTAFENMFGKTIDYKRLRTKYFFRFFGPMVTLAAVRIYFVHDLITHNSDKYFRFYWFHCVQSLMVSRTRCIQVAFYANLVNDRILWIHQEMRKIVQQKHLSQKALQMKVTVLRQIYALIYDVSVLINESFGWSLLIIVVSYFVDSVGNCFMLYLVIENITSRSTQISAIVGFVSVSIALITLCYSCGRCADNLHYPIIIKHRIKFPTVVEKASTTYDIIGKVLSHKVIWATDYQLQEILLQVRHQNVVISANNFFTIDMNLLASIVSATITYIIVIIQA